MEQAINNRKKLIENESKLLEDHRKKTKKSSLAISMICLI